MNATTVFPMTRQGLRNLDEPLRRKDDAVNVGSGERTVSALGGAVVAGIGLTKGGFGGLLLMVLGSALTYRGYSGHCAAYALAGVNTAK